MSGPPAAQAYRLRARLTWRLFDDEWVVRNHSTGSLVQLAPLPAALLGLIEGGLTAEDQLCAAVAEASGQSVLTGVVHQALEQLSSADLVIATPT